MPLTLSHPAAVLPLRRLGLPLSALVLGSMVPDASLFVGWTWGYAAAHSALGVVTFDVAATLALLVLWSFVVRDALVDLAPAAVRARLDPRARLARRQWLLAPVAAAVGAATHVVWDSFTHAGRWGVRHVTWLQDEHAGLTGAAWAQYVSGVVGLAVVVWASVAHVSRLPPALPPRAPRALGPAYLVAAVATAVAAGVAMAALSVPSGFHVMAFNGVVMALAVGALALATVCGAWQVAVRTSGGPPP